jgi:hypothetical protein
LKDKIVTGRVYTRGNHIRDGANVLQLQFEHNPVLDEVLVLSKVGATMKATVYESLLRLTIAGEISGSYCICKGG